MEIELKYLLRLPRGSLRIKGVRKLMKYLKLLLLHLESGNPTRDASSRFLFLLELLPLHLHVCKGKPRVWG